MFVAFVLWQVFNNSMVNIQAVIDSAKKDCLKAGARLTEKRENVLKLLLEQDAPISAYGIVDLYREKFSESLPAMSVYRMLDFLQEHKLVHKLATSNQYLSCAHIACDHDHNVPQFLICDSCNGVEEVALRKELMMELQNSVAKTGFSLLNQQLELHGRCARCQK